MSKKNHSAVATPDVVRQSELQHLVDLHNEIQMSCFRIRRRLESGAFLECGKLGVTNAGQESLEEFAGEETLDEFEDSGYVSVCGHCMEVAPVEHLLGDVQSARTGLGCVPGEVWEHEFVLGVPMEPFGPAHSMQEFQSIAKIAAFQTWTAQGSTVAA